MIGTAELILFAIQAGVKLAKAGRTIYVEETIRGEVAFPLPSTLNSPYTTASSEIKRLSFYDIGTRERLAYDEKLRDVLLNGSKDDTVAAYLEYMRLGVIKPLHLPARERAGLAMIRQWEGSDDPLPHPMQRIAGTLVGIAIDYFVQAPGAISTDSKYGKTLLALLKGLDDVRFDEARWDSMVIALFTAGLDAIKANPELFADGDGGDDKQAAILRTAVNGMANDLAERMKSLGGPDVFDAEERLQRFGTIVFRSILSGASRKLIDNPDVLGVKDKAKQELVRGVGSAFLDLLLDESEGQLDLAKGLRRLASADGLEKLVHASLKVAAEHPELLKTNNESINTWLKNIVTGLYELYPQPDDLFEPEMLSSLAYLVISHGIDDLHGLVLRKLSPGKQALAVEVASNVLRAMVKPPSGNSPAKWDFHLSRTELLNIVSGTLSSLSEHPEWLFSNDKHRQTAAAVLPFVVTVLGQAGTGGEGGWLKALARSSQLEPALAAVLTSGVIEQFAPSGELEATPEAIAKILSKILKKLADHGLRNASALLDYGLLHDLLVAAREAGLIQAFLDDPNLTNPAYNRLLKLIDQLRAGESPSIPDMTAQLEAA